LQEESVEEAGPLGEDADFGGFEMLLMKLLDEVHVREGDPFLPGKFGEIVPKGMGLMCGVMLDFLDELFESFACGCGASQGEPFFQKMEPDLRDVIEKLNVFAPVFSLQDFKGGFERAERAGNGDGCFFLARSFKNAREDAMEGSEKAGDKPFFVIGRASPSALASGFSFPFGRLNAIPVVGIGRCDGVLKRVHFSHPSEKTFLLTEGAWWITLFPFVKVQE
jgi:hypothetical protein